MIISSEMTNFLDIFEDHKIDKIDIISCHDPHVVKCRKLFIFLLGFISSTRECIYMEYEIMKMNALINAT